MILPLALATIVQTSCSAETASYIGIFTAAYHRRHISTGSLTPVTDRIIKSFSRCASDCDYRWVVTNHSETCHAVAYDMETRRCTLTLIDLSVIPRGATTEIYLKFWFTGR